MNQHEIQTDILQAIKAFGDCVLTTRMLMLGFIDDADFEGFKARHKLASTYDKASGQTTFGRAGGRDAGSRKASV